jgi:H+/Cl- antiporter ClcA
MLLVPLRRAADHSFVDLPPRVVGLTLLSGILGGLVGAGYLLVLHVLQHVLWPTGHSPLIDLLVLSGVGLVVGLLVRGLGSPGDVELMVDNIHVSGTATGLRMLRSLLPTSWLCIAAGGAMGPEAPLVQTTGSLASHAAIRAGLPTREARVLTISGMAAGFAVLFGAPLGAAVFALELLHRRGLQYYEAIMPAVVGALCGWAVHAIVTDAGLAPVWHLPAPVSLRPGDVAWAVVAGLAGVAVAGAFVLCARGLRRAARRLPTTFRPLAGGVLLAGLGAASAWSLTFGEDQVGEILRRNPVTVGLLLAAALAKLAATSVTWAFEWRGGFIIPLFFVGACVGRAIHVAVPGTTNAVLVAAVMAACVAGVTRTPLGSALVVSGMAGMRLLPTTLIASVVAFACTGGLALIATQRERDPDPAGPLEAA